MPTSQSHLALTEVLCNDQLIQLIQELAPAISSLSQVIVLLAWHPLARW